MSALTITKCGVSKTWYGVPGHVAYDFENVVRENVYDGEILIKGADAKFNFLMGKTTMFHLERLSKHEVLVYKVVQDPGEFIITFPQAYHASFSMVKILTFMYLLPFFV